MKILANDGINQEGVKILKEKGFEVILNKIPQSELMDYINENQIEVLLVRSATEVRKNLIDNCPDLKIIGRGGVGMDNIDVNYAKEKGIHVINTPSASSPSVAELVFAHLFTGARFLEDSNRKMPIVGNTEFSSLKKNYKNGIELRGKTLGIVGFGRIGNEVAKIAIGLGMNVLAADQLIDQAQVELRLFNGQTFEITLHTSSLEELYAHSDFITYHVPAQKQGYLVSENEISKMKNGVALINCARGGVIDEKALLNALNSQKVSFAGIDVFENEPTPSQDLLSHPRVSLTPHTGASTQEAQARIGVSLAEQICALLEAK